MSDLELHFHNAQYTFHEMLCYLHNTRRNVMHDYLAQKEVDQLCNMKMPAHTTLKEWRKQLEQEYRPLRVQLWGVDIDNLHEPSWCLRKCGAVRIWCDSQNAVAEANKPENWVSNKLRHIKTGYHFLCGYIQDKLFSLEHVPGDFNCSDIMTKGWGKSKAGAENQRAAEWRRHADFCLGTPSAHGIHGSALGTTPSAVPTLKQSRQEESRRKADRTTAPAAAAAAALSTDRR